MPTIKRSYLLIGAILVVAAYHGVSILSCSGKSEPAPTSPVQEQREPGEFEIHDGLPFAVALSPDGNLVAVAVTDRKTSWVDLYDLRTGVQEPRLIKRFGVDVYYDLEWHPTRQLVAAVAETGDISLLDINKRQASFLINSYPPTDVLWVGNSDDILVSFMISHDQPGLQALFFNVRTGVTRPVPTRNGSNPIVIGADGKWSESDDYATLIPGNYHDQAIVCYHKQASRWSWIRRGNVPPRVDQASKHITAYPELLSWLDDGHFAYVMVYPSGLSDDISRVEVWTCRRDGSGQKRWLILPDAEPPAIGSTSWVSVSGNRKRIAYFRQDRLFVFAEQDLLKHSRVHSTPRTVGSD